MIAKESIERVKQEGRLIEIVSETVSLKRSGMHYCGLCPFHAEKTPSFYVRETTNSYNCFGCGASGNIISFVMSSKGLSFPDAIEYLAERFKIPLVYEKGGSSKTAQPTQSKEELYKVTRLAQTFFRKSIQQIVNATGEYKILKEYLKSRGLRQSAINEFGIGYAPNSRDALYRNLKEAGVSEEHMLASGVIRRTVAGELIDLFRGRLIFPIWLDTRRIVAFGGRLVPGIAPEAIASTLPKYINSPEGPLYQKSRTLFGLPQALKAIKNEGELFLVEGYMDVVGLWQGGIKNVLASCGTAVGEGHITRLSQFAGRVHLLFDGDRAGRAAAERIFPIARNAVIDIDAIFLPAESDPDDFARTHGEKTADEIKNLTKEHLLNLYIDSLLEKYGCEKGVQPGPNLLGKIVDEICNVLDGIEKIVVKSGLISRAARHLGISPELINQVLNEKDKPIQLKVPELIEQTEDVSLSLVDIEIIRAVMVKKEQLIEKIVNSAELCELLNPETLSFISQLRDILTGVEEDREKQRDKVKQLLLSFGPNWVTMWKDAYERDRGGVDMFQVFEQSAKRLRKKHLEELIEKMRMEGNSLPPDSPESAMFHEQVVALIKQRHLIA